MGFDQPQGVQQFERSIPDRLPHPVGFNTLALQKQRRQRAKCRGRLASLGLDFEFRLGDMTEVKVALHVFLNKSEPWKLFPQGTKFLSRAQVDRVNVRFL